MSNTSSSWSWKDDSGSALLEAGLVLPFLIALMIGIYDFGRGYETLSTAQKSMQVATRYLSLLPKSAICGWGGNRAKNLAVYGNVDGAGQRLLPGWSLSGIRLIAPADEIARTSPALSTRMTARIHVSGTPNR